MTFAYWRKCDFQVHTPRDPNWTGARPIGQGEEIARTSTKATAQDVDAARAVWAKNFVDQCVVKGLEAVALTDHHVIMVPYVQQEIATRKHADLDFDLWLFPGMELRQAAESSALSSSMLISRRIGEDKPRARLESSTPTLTKRARKARPLRSSRATMPISPDCSMSWQG
ncbi:MAG TPA: hypothetical protein VIE66_08825 [Methylocella sp.]|jgi:type III restriction enzyme